MEKNIKPKVFIDSNVFISGLYSENSSPGVIIDLFVKGKINITISQKVLYEIINVLKLKIPKILPKLQKLLMSTPPEIIKDPKPNSIERWSGLINESDALILEAAISCQPDYFITGDKHFFEDPKPVQKSGLKIIKPSEFINIISSST